MIITGKLVLAFGITSVFGAAVHKQVPLHLSTMDPPAVAEMALSPGNTLPVEQAPTAARPASAVWLPGNSPLQPGTFAPVRSGPIRKMELEGSLAPARLDLQVAATFTYAETSSVPGSVPGSVRGSGLAGVLYAQVN